MKQALVRKEEEKIINFHAKNIQNIFYYYNYFSFFIIKLNSIYIKKTHTHILNFLRFAITT